MAREMKNSGIEWIGEIPAEWDVLSFTKSIESIVDYRGKTPEKQDEGTLLITARNIKDGKIDYSISKEYVRTEEFDQIMHRGKVEIGDVLFTTEAPLGSVANADRTDFALAQRIIKFRGKSNVLDNYFLKYWIMSDGFQQNLSTFSTGSTALGIKASKLGMLKQVLPSIDEQMRIVEFLDNEGSRIDSVIDKTRASIEEYKKLKQAVITQAVTKGIRPDRQLKDSGIEWIGAIPVNYSVERIKHLGNYRNGLTYAPEDIVDEEFGTLVLRSSNIQQGRLCFEDNVYVDSVIPERLMVQKDDIIICSRNGSRELIGKCAIVEEDIKASFGAFMMSFRGKTPKYMYYILNSNVFKYYLSTFLTSTINQLTGSNFGNMAVVWCDDQIEQAEIVEYLDHKTAEFDLLIQKKEQLLSSLESYKKSLIYEYVTGKKEVPA